MFKKFKTIFYSDSTLIDPAIIENMDKSGHKILAGCIPDQKKTSLFGKTIYPSLEEAKDKTNCNCVVLLSQPKLVLDAFLECVENQIEWVICLSKNIAQEDLLEMKEKLLLSKTKLLGPDSSGICIPKEGIVGDLLPFAKGSVALIGKSTSLLYEVGAQLHEKNLGASIVMHLGNGPILGLGFKQAIQIADDLETTKAIVLLSDVTGNEELESIEEIKKTKKPIIYLMAGALFPEIKSVEPYFIHDKINALKNTHTTFASSFLEIGNLCEKALQK